MSATKYRHPETGEEKTAAEWIEITGRERSNFYKLVKEGNPRAFSPPDHSMLGNATNEWKALDNTKKSMNPLSGNGPSKWERENIPEYKSDRECSRRLPPPARDIKPSEKEMAIYRAFASAGEPVSLGDIAKKLDKSPAYVGKKASRLKAKGLILRVSRGVYSAGKDDGSQV